MSTPKSKINWIYVCLGAVCIASYFYSKSPDMKRDDLSTRTVTLNKPLEFLKGSKSTGYYRLWTNETKAAFTIASAGSAGGIGSALDSLKKGDTLTLKYYSHNQSKLKDGAEEIPIYYLEKSGHLFFTLESYNDAKHGIDKRWNIVISFIGIIMLLNGLTIINTKTSYIIGGAGFLAIIVLKLMDIW